MASAPLIDTHSPISISAGDVAGGMKSWRADLHTAGDMARGGGGGGGEALLNR